jgi:hypothetical protein
LTGVFFASVPEALKKEEERQCLQWQRWQKEIRPDLFSPNEEMKKQCQEFGIELK